MNDIEEKLKAFNLDDRQLQDAMRCAQMSSAGRETRQAFIVETVIVKNGRSVVTNKEESHV